MIRKLFKGKNNEDVLKNKNSSKQQEIVTHQLYKVNPEDVPLIPFKNKIIEARVVDVYDGDTCTIIYLNESIFVKEKIRVLGIDTPEKIVRGKRSGTHLGELEQQAAIHVQKKVEELLLDKIVSIKRTKFDKYGGRCNGEIYLSSEHKWPDLTHYLIDKKYGKQYSGNKKEDWSENELQYILDN